MGLTIHVRWLDVSYVLANAYRLSSIESSDGEVDVENADHDAPPTQIFPARDRVPPNHSICQVILMYLLVRLRASTVET